MAKKGDFDMKKWDDVAEFLQDKNVVSDDILKKYFSKNEAKTENEKKGNTVLWFFAVIGVIAAVAAIAYAVYRYMTPDYLDDFDDDFADDLEDDFFDDEEDEAEGAHKASDDSEKESEAEKSRENEYTIVK